MEIKQPSYCPGMILARQRSGCWCQCSSRGSSIIIMVIEVWLQLIIMYARASKQFGDYMTSVSTCMHVRFAGANKFRALSQQRASPADVGLTSS